MDPTFVFGVVTLAMLAYLFVGLVVTTVLVEKFPPHSSNLTFGQIGISIVLWPLYPYVAVLSVYQGFQERQQRRKETKCSSPSR